MSQETNETAPAIETAAAAEITPANPAQKRLSAEQWAEIEAHWQNATKTGAELSAEYGVSGSALHQHFRKHNIVRGSNKAAIAAQVSHQVAQTVAAAVAPAAAAATAKAIDFDAKRKDRIEQTKEQLYLAAQANFANLNKLQRAMLKDPSDPEYRKPEHCIADLKAIRIAEAIVAQNIESRWKILDVDNQIDEAKLPVLTIKDLDEEEIERLKATDTDDEIDLPEFESELENEIVESEQS